MNQTKKRLSIINLAISITDIETIQLQILKLGLLQTDTKIQEIITVLQAENYAKAQRLIKIYIDTPVEEILQRASQQKKLNIGEPTTIDKKETIISDEDQKIIDEFQLFTISDDNSAQQIKKQEINLNDYFTDTPNLSKSPIDPQEASFDALLNIEADDIMPDNIELDISEDFNDSFFSIPEEEKVTLDTKSVPKDTFFEIEETEEKPDKETSSKENFEILSTVGRDRKASLIKDALKKKNASEKALQATSLRKKVSKKNHSSKTETRKNTADMTHQDPLKEKLPKKSRPKKKIEHYPAISYIRQKFVNMKKQYDPIQESHERFPTVETFLTTISQDGYKEKQIEETLDYVEKLITEQKFSEAAQLLLVCASTESKFARLMLARELYRGVLLRKNVTEAFTLLTHLAEDNYPDALCDLGQFYEHAISIERDRKKAEELYKKSMELGIKRAKKHYERLKKQNKGFFRK